jgi:hypothetical protein
MLHQDEPALSATTVWYLREFGPLLTSSQAAKLLGYRNAESLRQARLANRLPVPMFKIDDRRGWYAATAAVARWVEATVQKGAKP